MSSRITVVNRTSMTVWVGLDGYVASGACQGWFGNAQLAPATSVDFVVSGHQLYHLGCTTVISGSPSGPQSSGVRGLMIYDVPAGNVVTVATELGMPTLRSESST